MHDLIGVSAQNETIPGAQQTQDHVELRVRQILHLIDDDKIILRLA